MQYSNLAADGSVTLQLVGSKQYNLSNIVILASQFLKFSSPFIKQTLLKYLVQTAFKRRFLINLSLCLMNSADLVKLSKTLHHSLL